MDEDLKLQITKKVENFIRLCNDEYALAPITQEEEVEFFEKKFGVKLPKEYKWFILNVAGGILSKRLWGSGDIIRKLDFKNYFFNETEFNPSIPFPFTSKSDYDDLEDIEEHGTFNGNITIHSSVSLIVNGKEYGNVWFTAVESDCVKPFKGLLKNRNKNRYSFIQWLHAQLDSLLLRYNYDKKQELSK